MKREDAEEFTQSLGQIVGGSWRQIALAKRLGVPKALGLDIDDWVNQRLGGYVKMTVEDRRKAVEELAANGDSTRVIGAVLGVHHSTVEADLRGGNPPQRSAKAVESGGNPPPVDAVAALGLTERAQKSGERRELRETKERQAKEDLTRPVALLRSNLYRGDFRDESPKIIAADSVELVFTDPPYEREALPLYEAAAMEAARILKPGGSLVCYVGQILLPEALVLMSKHLRYWWTAACVHESGNQMMNKYGIRCGWKPLMWFVKGTRGDINNVLLDTVSGTRAKASHEWQQAEAEAAYFIEKLCSENGVVVDLFAGSGTTCVVAQKLRRSWIAFEPNARHYESAAKRLAPILVEAA